MQDFVAYHKIQDWGDYPEAQTSFRHFSRKSIKTLNKLKGNRVWVVSGFPDGGSTVFHLCAHYIVGEVVEGEDMHSVEGEGTSFVPHLPLNDLEWFAELKSEQANFSLGLNAIRSETVTNALHELAENQSDQEDVTSPARERALSIRQPHAEAIMRGVKTIEYRTAPTKIRGTITIYASLGRYSEEEEATSMQQYGIDDVSCDDLPRGLLIGTAELHDCDGGEWYLRNPKRAKELRKPQRHPQPVWFFPFDETHS